MTMMTAMKNSDSEKCVRHADGLISHDEKNEISLLRNFPFFENAADKIFRCGPLPEVDKMGGGNPKTCLLPVRTLGCVYL